MIYVEGICNLVWNDVCFFKLKWSYIKNNKYMYEIVKNIIYEVLVGILYFYLYYWNGFFR